MKQRVRAVLDGIPSLVEAFTSGCEFLFSAMKLGEGDKGLDFLVDKTDRPGSCKRVAEMFSGDF